MLLRLNDLDRSQYYRLKDAGVLQDLDGHRIRSEEGTIKIPCSDGDQFRDVFGHHCVMCESERQHPVCLNGGAMLISIHSPIPHANVDGAVLLRHASAASLMKGINTLVLYAHAPCGVAYHKKLDLFEVLRLLAEAKLRCMEDKRLRHLEISCFFHVDLGGGHKRTHYVHRGLLTQFLANNNRRVRCQRR